MLSKSAVKYIQSLGHKKFRDREQAYIIEGVKIVNEFLEAAPSQVQEIYALEEWVADHGHLAGNRTVNRVEPHELAKISQLVSPQQVLAVVRKPDYTAPASCSGCWTLALDDIRDPGNLGTLIRIADWFGVKQVVCSQETADTFNPKVVQASMGSILRIPVHYVDLAEWLAGEKTICFAAMLNGETTDKLHGLAEGILLIGNEAHGIREDLLPSNSRKITIPRKGAAESLNAAIAAAVILSHI